jgi:hypothetical protein
MALPCKSRKVLQPGGQTKRAEVTTWCERQRLGVGSSCDLFTSAQVPEEDEFKFPILDLRHCFYEGDVQRLPAASNENVKASDLAYMLPGHAGLPERSDHV